MVLEIDEEGAAAASESAVVSRRRGAIYTALERQFIVDQPFVFLLVDKRANVVLFYGSVRDPSKKCHNNNEDVDLEKLKELEVCR